MASGVVKIMMSRHEGHEHDNTNNIEGCEVVLLIVKCQASQAIKRTSPLHFQTFRAKLPKLTRIQKRGNSKRTMDRR
jgi:hypothetical protein